MTIDQKTISHTQRAWTWHGQASPNALRLSEIAVPKLAAGEILVRNQIIGLNPVDWKVLRGLPSWNDGHVTGVDGAGIVVAVGDESLMPWLGRRVAYHQSLHKQGSYAEYTPVAARTLMQVPDGLSMTLAASIPCPALTAWLALDKLPLRSDAQLLVSGAGGGVGNYIVQLGLQRGYAVTAMCNERHWDRLRALGVRDFIAGPLTSGNELASELLGRSFAVIDMVSDSHAALLTPLLEANGHLVCVQDRLTSWPGDPFGRCLSVHEVALGALHLFGSKESWARLVHAGETIMKHIHDHELQPEPVVIRDFSSLPNLLDDLRQRTFSGKPLIKVN